MRSSLPTPEQKILYLCCVGSPKHLTLRFHFHWSNEQNSLSRFQSVLCIHDFLHRLHRQWRKRQGITPASVLSTQRRSLLSSSQEQYGTAMTYTALIFYQVLYLGIQADMCGSHTSLYKDLRMRGGHEQGSFRVILLWRPSDNCSGMVRI